MAIKRENTMVLDFKNVRKKPPNISIHRWIKQIFNFTNDQLVCIQFDHIRSKVFIKVISEWLVKKTMQKFESGKLIYTDEEQDYEIYISEESDDIWIRIYDFPPELKNSKIIEHFGKYGIVKTIRNETWSGDDLYNVESGVRSMLISMKKKVPSYVTIEGTTSLVTYKNQERTCMFCDNPGHERRDCPNKPNNRIIAIRRPDAAIPVAAVSDAAVPDEAVPDDAVPDATILEEVNAHMAISHKDTNISHSDMDKISKFITNEITHHDDANSDSENQMFFENTLATPIADIKTTEDHSALPNITIHNPPQYSTLASEKEAADLTSQIDIISATPENMNKKTEKKRKKKEKSSESSGEEERKVPKLQINLKNQSSQIIDESEDNIKENNESDTQMSDSDLFF
ncbi:unnamed protein product [Psylliodes chrysocephalus]|uniref:CCHC-type domain-containing protein n=1 Tax=Psylliodes chrysocephalus TaxID=3402493 RepID=A0A9P0CFC6_9CUCU|nr:unnamed protein product [Psylliodes chrysocephala]